MPSDRIRLDRMRVVVVDYENQDRRIDFLPANILFPRYTTLTS